MLKWLGKVAAIQATERWPWILAALVVLTSLWVLGRRVQRREDRERKELLSQLAAALRRLETRRDGQ